MTVSLWECNILYNISSKVQNRSYGQILVYYSFNNLFTLKKYVLTKVNDENKLRNVDYVKKPAI